MELEFDKKDCRYLHCLASEIQNQEQTQELRLTEGMPDIGSVLGAWGQVLIRGKEWRGDSMRVSGGVMVWALYMPEDSSAPQKVEGWLPFQMKWQLPDTPKEGLIQLQPYLLSVDVRSISARKLMLRTVVEILAEAYIQNEVQIFQPESVPEELQLLKKQHSVMLPKEAGEKTFAVSETMQLPNTVPNLREVIRFSVQPEMIDRKVMSDKGVFRGSILLHVVYDDAAGQLHSWDFDVPFSQFTQLDGEYSSDAQLQVVPAVTALELEEEEDGSLKLNVGMTCQYLVYDKETWDLAMDVYSLKHEIKTDQRMLALPVVSHWEEKTVAAQQRLDGMAQRIVDVTFLPAAPRLLLQTDPQVLELSGQLQVLYYDEMQNLSYAVLSWNQNQPFPGQDVCCSNLPTGIPQGSVTSGQLQLSADLHLQSRIMDSEDIPMLTGVTLGEERISDPDRPNVILQRAGQQSLWQLAKEHGTTLEKIRKANGLEEDPAPGQMLLIPVP